MLSQREGRLSTKVHQGRTAATTSARAGALLGFCEIAAENRGGGMGLRGEAHSPTRAGG
jgi:hypothetical protein